MRLSSTLLTLSRPRKAARCSNGTTSQPIYLDTQPSQLRLSPRRALANALQATAAPLSSPTFKSQLRESRAEAAIEAPTKGSAAATIARTKASNRINYTSSNRATVDKRFADNFNGIDWLRLLQFIKPLSTQLHKKSWIYQHSYRVALRRDTSRIWFVC